MAAGTQEKTLSGFLSDLGVSGFAGIAATIDGTTNTTLDITVTQPAYAVLLDGTILAAELATTTMTGLSTNGTYHLYLTAVASGSDYAPVWTVAASAPDATALKIADVTVGSGHLTAVTMVATGLQGLNLQLNFKPTTPSFPATTTWAQNTTGQDVLAYVNTGSLTQTHIYLNNTNSATGALDLTSQAPTTILIPNGYYISFTYSAGTGAWVWQGKRTH